jgi:dienelactone hydrolase
VLVADLYGQGKRGTSMERGMSLMKEISDDRTVLRIRLLDALATLRGLPTLDASRLGAIGFCFGGQCVLDLARAGADIKVGVSFHGLYDAPPFPNATMTAKLLICHGWNDPLAAPDTVVRLATELTEAGSTGRSRPTATLATPSRPRTYRLMRPRPSASSPTPTAAAGRR